MSISFKAIKPKKFDARAIFDELKEAASDIAEGIHNDFRKTHETWSDSKYYTSLKDGGNTIPQFFVDHGVKRGMASAVVYTEEALYFFLNNDTDVRYATMTKGFQAKTQVGVIGSGPGVGGFAYLDVNTPREGIDGRFWDKAIARKHKPLAYRRWQEALERGIKRSGHGR